MQIHVMQDGQQFGPFSKVQIESFLWEGNVQRGDLAWHEGLEDWMPVWQIMGMDPLPEEVAEAGEEIVPEDETGELEIIAEQSGEREIVEEESSPVEIETGGDGTPEVVAEEEEPVVSETPSPVASSPDLAPEVPGELEAPPSEPDTVVPDASGRPRLIIPSKLPQSLAREPVAIPPGTTKATGEETRSPGLASYALARKPTHGLRWLAVPTVMLMVLSLFLPFFTIGFEEVKTAGSTVKEMLFGDALQVISLTDSLMEGLSGVAGEESVEGGEEANPAPQQLSTTRPEQRFPANFIRVCLWTILSSAVLVSLCGIMGARFPAEGYARWGVACAGVGVVALGPLAYYFSRRIEMGLMGPDAGSSAMAETAMGMPMMDFQLQLGAGFYGALAALLLGAGACLTPVFRSPSEGGTRMIVAVTFWFLAILSAIIGIVQWSKPSLEETAARQTLQKHVIEALETNRDSEGDVPEALEEEDNDPAPDAP